MIELRVTMDDTDGILRLEEQAIKKALTMIGILASDDAADLAKVDTGLLRNSMTYALSGESPAKKSYRADRGDGSGSYSGTIGSKDEKAVYVGTNVEYAPYVEMGFRHYASGKFIPAKNFLKNAVMNNRHEFQEIIKECLRG